jgi:hypothetical protein
MVGLLECAIRVAPFGRWRWSSFLPIVVVVIVVVLATTIITLVISSVVALVFVAIITMIAPAVIMPVVVVIVTVVVVSVVTTVVAAIITSITVIISRIGSTITVVSLIRLTITIVKTLATVPVVVVVAPGPLGGRRDSQGALQLLALPHGVFSIAVELALVIHDHVEVTFEEGGRSWWILHIGFAGSLARPGASVVVVFSIKVMHHYVLSVDQFIDVGHKVTNGVCVSFMNLLKYLDVGDPLLVLGNDVFVFDTCEGVALLEVAVGVLSESFVAPHPYSCEVVGVARTIVGHLVVGRKKARQCCPGGDALCWEIVEPQEWCLAHHKGETSCHVVFIASRGTCRDAVHLEPYTRVRATVVLLKGWFEVFGVSDHPETS